MKKCISVLSTKIPCFCLIFIYEYSYHDLIPCIVFWRNIYVPVWNNCNNHDFIFTFRAQCQSIVSIKSIKQNKNIFPTVNCLFIAYLDMVRNAFFHSSQKRFCDFWWPLHFVILHQDRWVLFKKLVCNFSYSPYELFAIFITIILFTG